jgi:hypothetical protein
MGLKFQDEEEGKRFDDRDSNPPNGSASFSRMTFNIITLNIISNKHNKLLILIASQKEAKKKFKMS